MPHTFEQKPNALVPFFLGLAPLGLGVHLFAPDAADPPELILSGVLISVGIILLFRALRNLFYKPDETALELSERRATVPFIERRKIRFARRASATRRWIQDRQSIGGVERRQVAYDRRNSPDRRVRRTSKRWEDPSVVRPIKPGQNATSR